MSSAATVANRWKPLEAWVSSATEWTNMASVLRRAQSTVRMNNHASFYWLQSRGSKAGAFGPALLDQNLQEWGGPSRCSKNPQTTPSPQLDYRPGAREGTAARRSARSSPW